MKYKVAVHLAGMFVGICCLLALTRSACGYGQCPDIPSGGGESIVGFAQVEAASCPVTDGMYIRPYKTLRLDSIATAFGQCQVIYINCVPGGGCTCGPNSTTQERVIGRTAVSVDMTTQSVNGSFVLGYVYGKNPNGTTAFLHVLDSTQANSTGPVRYAPASPGEYLLHYQANINTTNCNMLPATTPTYDTLVHVRTALHRGQVNNGSLSGCGAKMSVLSGTGYVYYQTGSAFGEDTYGSPEWAHKAIKEAGFFWYGAHPNGPRLQYGPISMKCGGPSSAHPQGTHQNGLNIDIRYLRSTPPPDHEGPLNVVTQSSSYSKVLTIELLNLLVSTGRIQSITLSPASNISNSDVPGVTLVPDTQGNHDNHIHLQLFDEDGPDSNNCDY